MRWSDARTSNTWMLDGVGRLIIFGSKMCWTDVMLSNKLEYGVRGLLSFFFFFFYGLQYLMNKSGCNELSDGVPRKKGVKVIGIETHSI